MAGSDHQDWGRLKGATLAMLPELLELWLPGGEFRGHQYVARNPTRADQNLGSFQIDVRSGRWRDHAIGVGGGDAASLLAYLSTAGDYGKALQLLQADPRIRAAIASGSIASARLLISLKPLTRQI